MSERVLSGGKVVRMASRRVVSLRRVYRAVVARASAVALAAIALSSPSLIAQGVSTQPVRATPRAPIIPDDSLTQKFEVAGIPVILRSVTANNVVAANLYLLGGVREVDESTQGMEAVLFETSERGTRKYPKGVLRQKMAQLGSAIGSSPGYDWTTLGLRSTVANFDSTWMILADQVVAPTLDVAEFELVRGQFVTAVKQRKDSPDALLDFLSDSIAFAGQQYALDPFGSEQSLSALKVDALREFHAKRVMKSRMLLVVVGNVSRSRVEKLVQETIGKLPQGDYRWSLPPVVEPLSSAYVIESRNLPTNYLQGYFAGPRADSRDYQALRLAAAVLSGRLFNEVRARRNLSYSVNAPFIERAQAIGGLYVTTTAPDDVLRIMQDQVTGLKESWITDDGLDRLVQQFIVTYFLDNETNADQANMLARAELYQGDYRRADQFVEELRAVTPEDIRRAARRYMTNIRWAYVGNPNRVDPARMVRFR